MSSTAALRTHEINVRRLANPPDPKDHQDHECVACKRPIAVTVKTWWIECVGGTLIAVHRDERHLVQQDDPGYMGCHPIGNGCARKIPAAFRFRMD